MASEFKENDVSNNDCKEEQSSSSDEYEQEDDYRIGGGSVAPCGKQSYEHFWTSEASRIPADLCQPDAIPIGSLSVYESKENAFGAIISPGIINSIVVNTNLALLKVHAKHFDKTDGTEIKALIGLWLKLGITGFHNLSVEEICWYAFISLLYRYFDISLHQ